MAVTPAESDGLTTDSGKFSIVPEWLLRSNVSDKAVRLYATLGAVWANQSDRCWPTRETLAATMQCSVSSVVRATRDLIDAGALRVIHRYDGERQTSNMYVIVTVNPGRGAVTSDREDPVTSDTGGVSPVTREPDPSEPDPEESNSSRPTPTAFDVDSREYRLCQFFIERLMEADPTSKRPTISMAWLKEADRLFRLDDRDRVEIREIIDWVFLDPAGSFWVSNCRSIPKFRTKYETMRAQMQRSRGGPAASARSAPMARDDVQAGEIKVGPGGLA